MSKIRTGIVGYGNIGRGVEKIIRENPDFELTAILTRRPPEELATGSPSALKIHVDDAPDLKGKVDIMILCGGSATDLPLQGPEFAKNFNTVDSYDTHKKIPKYYDAMNEASKKSGLISVISAGWDPGLFSMNRVIMKSVLPNGSSCTFWGKGVSQGHSDAIRRIAGVEMAVQYTIPVATAIEKARKGEGESMTPRDKHIRECFVVVKDGADKRDIEDRIKTMPYYFADNDTIVHFISKEEFIAGHSGMPHGGFVIHSSRTGGNRQIMEFSLNLCSNPEFTASVLIAFARAAYRYYGEGRTGALTALDIPLSYLSAQPDEELRREML